MTFAGDEDTVTGVVNIIEIKLALDGGPIFLLQEWGGVGAIIHVHRHLLQCVGALNVGELVELLSQADRGSDVNLTEARGKIVEILVKQMGGESKSLTHEPWFSPVHVERGGARSVAKVHVKALTCPAEVLPVGDVEVCLGDCDKSHKTVDRTETCTEVHRPGGFFGHVDLDILETIHLSGDRTNGQRIGLTFALKVIHVFKHRLGCFELHRVEFFSGSEGQFTTNHFIFRLRISADVDLADEGFAAFKNNESDIEPAWSGVGKLSIHPGIRVAARAIVIENHFLILAHFGAGIN